MTTLRAARLARLWSQRELARRSGISPLTIITTETGRRRPALATIRRLSEALQVPPLEVAEFASVIRGEETQ
jgi:transcriptional regulator with XRE-family HTH domain